VRLSTPANDWRLIPAVAPRPAGGEDRLEGSALRRTPLTELLAARNKLNTLKLGNLKLGNLKLGNLKLGNLKLGNFKLGGLGRRGKTLAYGGTALALAGIGGVTAAAATTSATPAAAGISGTSHRLSVGDAAGVQFGSGVRIHAPAASASAAPSGAAVANAEQPGAAHSAAGSGHTQAAAASGHAQAAAGHAQAAVGHAQAAAGYTQAAAGYTQAAAGSGHVKAAGHAKAAGSGHMKAAGHAKAAGSARTQTAASRHATARGKSLHVVRHGSSKSWKQIRDELASQTSPRAKPGTLPLADRLEIGSASGSQSYLPIDAGRMANATAIVRQALNKHMGVRAAVIAVATAMQESGLENISYGDRDSLGLFQQRPSMGWGTASQITTPSYAADAFLGALAAHQKADPAWAGEPLWATAQAVQKSGFPFAYAKWEKQAAQLVTTIATKLG
jgi:hypothetical protein